MMCPSVVIAGPSGSAGLSFRVLRFGPSSAMRSRGFGRSEEGDNLTNLRPQRDLQ